MKIKRPAECLDYESTERAAASCSTGVESFAQSKDPFFHASETGHFYPTAAGNVPGISFKQNLQRKYARRTIQHKSAGIILNGCPCPVSFGLGASTTQCGESPSMVWTIILLFFPFVLLLYTITRATSPPSLPICH
jgi:hypothetical protein